MTPAALRSELDRFVTLGLREGFVLSGQTPTLTDLGGGRKRVAPPPPPTASRASLLRRSATPSEYRQILQTGDFLAALVDGSILQASYILHRNEVVSHRLAYYPCPVTFDREELELATLDEVVAAALSAGPATGGLDEDIDDSGPSVRLGGPWRFDFERDPPADHAASHCHVAADSCRIPVYGPLSPGHFFRFVFRHFLPEVWAQQGVLRAWALSDLGRTIRAPDEVVDIHLSWQRDAAALGAAVA